MINKTEKEIMSAWRGDIDHPKVSICCITYNHEKYIEEAIDSFLLQETDFPFEIVIHDDASTDNTTAIIKEYEEHYPLIIKPIFEKVNQYSKNKETITEKINKTIKGDFIAFCEGDDCWIDNKKIYKQYTLISKNGNYSAIVHNTIVKDQKTGNNYLFNTEINSNEIIKSGRIVRWMRHQFHFSSIMCRRELYRIPVELTMKSIGDYPLAMWLMINGEIYYINETMSMYRSNVTESWTQRTNSNKSDLLSHIIEKNEYIKRFNKYTSNKYFRYILVEYIEDKIIISSIRENIIMYYFWILLHLVIKFIVGI